MSRIEQTGFDIGLDWANLREMLAERPNAGSLASVAANPEQGAAAASLGSAAASQSPTNVMAGNFFSSNKESRYVVATLDSFRQQSVQEIAKNSSLTAQLDELSAWVTSDNPAVARKQIERALQRKRDQKLYAEAERAAQEARAEQDRLAAENRAPKGVDGEPLLPEPSGAQSAAAAGSSGSILSSPIAAASARHVQSGPDPATAAGGQVTSEFSGAQAQSGPAQVSLDIQV